VDLIGVADKVSRAKQARSLGARFIEFHAGLDEQAQPGCDLRGVVNAGEEARVPFSVAGGVNASTIAAVQLAGADVAVAGSAIYSAADPELAAKELKAAIQ